MASRVDFDTKLIDLVRANPLLYEKEVRSSPYNLMKKKAELWRSIAASLGVETKYCVIRWKNLRERFRRELQKAEEIERKSGGVKNIGKILRVGATAKITRNMSILVPRDASRSQEP